MDTSPDSTIRRGKAVEFIANSIGIDLEDTSWIDEPLYVAAPWHSKTERVMVWLYNHEWRVWYAVICYLVLSMVTGTLY